MEYIAGTLGLEATVAVQEVWALLSARLRAIAGQLGYRQPSVGVRDKDEIPTFILISDRYGIAFIDVVDDKLVRWDDNKEYMIFADGSSIPSRDIVLENFQNSVETRLKTDLTIWNRSTQRLAISCRSIIILRRNTDSELASLQPLSSDRIQWLSGDDFEQKLIDSLENIPHQALSEGLLDACISKLEGTSVLSRQPRIPRNLDPVTKNDFIQNSLRTVFKLDQTQRKISLQIPDGPQRIRGLAGTGKTVILCLKAALAHKDLPDFKILFLFNTQSMYPHIRDLIGRYYAHETKDVPNWDNLNVLHAWGGRSQEGLYYNVSRTYGVKPLTYSDVSASRNALNQIYEQLLSTHRTLLKPEYDIVLIDEAQDFTSPLFETAFLLTKEPKRIIWAYDEFQSMTDIRLPSPEILFGVNEKGEPNIPNSALEGKYPGEIEKDYILPNSYRNPRLTLMAAHGIALGLYRPAGAVDVIEERRDWDALGYRVIEPPGKIRFIPGDDIVVERPTEYSRNILESLLTAANRPDKELITVNEFTNKAAELRFVADSILEIVQKEQVPPEDIVVVTLSVGGSKAELTRLRSLLMTAGLKAIMPGFIERPSLFKEKGHITLTTPFRAKGNEANVVFVISSELVTADVTFRRRNAAFVSITRSRGWTYVSGIRTGARELAAELDGILTDYPRLKFRFPAQVELDRRRKILASDDELLERQNQVLEELFSTNRDLLIEKIRSDPDLAEAIRRELTGQ
jgi:superfamily I DNA and RNA helicase